MSAELFDSEGFRLLLVDVVYGVVEEMFVSVNGNYIKWSGCGMVGEGGWLSGRGNGSFKGLCGLRWWGGEACVRCQDVLWDPVLWNVCVRCVVD